MIAAYKLTSQPDELFLFAFGVYVVHHLQILLNRINFRGPASMSHQLDEQEEPRQREVGTHVVGTGASNSAMFIKSSTDGSCSAQYSIVPMQHHVSKIRCANTLNKKSLGRYPPCFPRLTKFINKPSAAGTSSVRSGKACESAWERQSSNPINA